MLEMRYTAKHGKADILFLAQIVAEILPIVDYLNEDLIRHKVTDLREQNKATIRSLNQRLTALEEHTEGMRIYFTDKLTETPEDDRYE